ncbi:MAG: hypothetical protein ABIH82_03525 [Candidatus Woesearchaeota archaeon]
MNEKELKELVKKIVKEANDLKNKHTSESTALVNYACIFSQNEEEYKELLRVTQKMGKLIEETKSGFLFHIKSIQTIAGVLKLLKIRIPDITRPEQGDADFTVSDYVKFKKKYLVKPGWNLMKKREDFEMLELMDPKFDVRVYFSNPPLDQQLGID